ncbi:MAG: UvrD-helicase domain-containing protein [Pseudomonadales bacterium]
MNLKSDLEMDFETFKNHPDTPIFHRIRFDSTSIYLTKSYFYKLTLSSNDHGHYRVFSWDDVRAKQFLTFELGDESPALGGADLIGRYSPTDDDLTNVQYDSLLGKGYFKSARQELEQGFKSSEYSKNKKIDSTEFMRMNEIIPTGAQGKAIYGEGNYIIDGPAGTGKSTTVLQKIKLLQKNGNVNPNKICILVKNEMVVSEFQRLLNTIGIVSLRIATTRDFISDNFLVGAGVGDRLISVRDASVDTCWCFNKIVAEASSISRNRITHIGDSDSEFLRVIDDHSRTIRKFKSYVRKRDRVVTLVSGHRKEIQDKKLEMDKESQDKADSIAMRIRRKRDESERLRGTNHLVSKEDDRDLTLGEEVEIRDEVNKVRLKKEKEIDKLKKEYVVRHANASDGLVEMLEKIKSSLLSISFSKTMVEGESELSLIYNNKLMGNSTPFHTVIVDEAQDVSLADIELTWLLSKNVILTGDEMQAEHEYGIGRWQNLFYLAKEFSKDDELDIFTLKHNFRQTYELGNCSFNFRQLAMDRNFVDLKGEYFENQIGFRKPNLVYIEKELDFIGLVNEKIELIDGAFTDSIPVTIFYENGKVLKKLSGLLDKEKISYSVDENEDQRVMFVALENIAGRSFPVVLAPLANSTEKNTIYIMLSRAKYDLSLFTGPKHILDKNIEILLDRNVILSAEK